MNISAVNKNLYTNIQSGVYKNKVNNPGKVSVPENKPVEIKKEDRIIKKDSKLEEKEVKDAYEKLSSESVVKKDEVIKSKDSDSDKDNKDTVVEKEKQLLEEKQEIKEEKKEQDFKEKLKEINKEYVDENTENIEKMIKGMQLRQELKTQISMQKRIENTIEKISDDEEAKPKDIKELNGQRISEFKEKAQKQTEYLKEVLSSIQDKEKTIHFNPQKEKIDKFSITI